MNIDPLEEVFKEIPTLKHIPGNSRCCRARVLGILMKVRQMFTTNEHTVFGEWLNYEIGQRRVRLPDEKSVYPYGKGRKK